MIMSVLKNGCVHARIPNATQDVIIVHHRRRRSPH